MNDNSVNSTEAQQAKTFSVLTWNIEGIKSGVFVLKKILEQKIPDMVFLSEPSIFQPDLPNILKYLNGEYCSFLNSDDLYDQELPLIRNFSVGGTLCLWKKWLDPYIKVHAAPSSSFTPVILKLPNYQTSIHIGVYLPTHGKDTQFVSDLADLRICLEELCEAYPDALLFIRGDANVNQKNRTRVALLESFLLDFHLTSVHILHKTYHHFVGNGAFDSNVDILVHSTGISFPESVNEILCKNEHPLLSHHDIIMSQFSLPAQPSQQVQQNLMCAPKMDIRREMITWSDEGSKQYQSTVTPHLKRIRENWLDPNSKASIAILLQMTNTILAKSASATNKAKLLGTKKVTKSAKTPKAILRAQHLLTIANKDKHALPEAFNLAKANYRKSVRRTHIKTVSEQVEKVNAILLDNPTGAYGFIKSCRRSPPALIEKLTVGTKTYEGPAVADGFYDSMSSIKSCNMESLATDPKIAEHLSNHEHILKLCKDKKTIPSISLDQSSALLKRMKQDVRDFYCISAKHYVNAGTEGLLHFNFLLNAIISDVNIASLDELNLVYGLILYKGHGKEKTSDRSYRTISTCPFLAKSLDLYLRDLYHEHWDACQAETQYQGTGSNHELAALLITEVVQHSLNVSNKPVFLLALDAQSAFDRCLRQILSTELYKANITGTALTLIDTRLANRATVYEYDGVLMGPSKDDTGFEQGGINSGDFYKMYNNEQLKTAQKSELGVNIGSSTISAAGQADDVMLSSNSISNLNLLVTLTESYCRKYRVKLVPSKTKLLVYSNDNHKYTVDHAKLINPISIDGVPVKFTTEAEHVGIVRHISGNMPNILNRITAHKKSMGSVLSAGLSRSHRGNAAASLRVHQLYCQDVLLSGLAAQVLTKAEIKIIDSYYQVTLQNLQRLHTKTPRSVVLFLAGSLPGEAILHKKQLTLYSMICRLPSDPLNAHARHVLTRSPPSAKSWFLQIRDICLLYSLPHPLNLLDNPPTKTGFKTLVKAKVTAYWENILMQEAMALDSLLYFKPTQYSLQQPSLIWSTAGNNIYECHKSAIIGKMISGRYRSEDLCRHWTPSNKNGFCLADTCSQVKGDLVHILVLCPALHAVRDRLTKLWLDRSASLPALYQLICKVLTSPPSVLVQFILDPSTFPGIITLWEIHGQPLLEHVFYLTRTYAYYMHREKLISIGRWPGDPGRRKINLSRQYKPGTNQTQTKKSDLGQPSINKDLCLKNDSISNYLIFPGTNPDDPTSSPDTLQHCRQSVPQINPSNTSQSCDGSGYEDCAGLGLSRDCGVSPDGVALCGVAPDGVAPGGVAPSGVAPGGVAPGGVVYAAVHAACGGRQGGDAGVCSGGDRVASSSSFHSAQ